MIEGDKDGPWTVQTLKQYFERIICDLNRRLTGLDTFAQAAKDKERDFYSRAQHDEFARGLGDELNRIRNDIEASRRPNYLIWFAAISLFMSATGVLWYLAVQPIQIDIAHLKQQDDAIVDARKERGDYIDRQNKSVNDRIDRLYELYRDLQSQHTQAIERMQKSPR